MSLIKWNPASSLSSWMDDFFADTGEWLRPGTRAQMLPAVNISENKNTYALEVAAPGFKKEDFKLEIRNGYLTIKGETRTEEEKKEDRFTRREFRYNTFSRSFSLPDNVDPEGIAARYQDGILHVDLPKTNQEHDEPTKTIEIK